MLLPALPRNRSNRSVDSGDLLSCCEGLDSSVIVRISTFRIELPVNFLFVCLVGSMVLFAFFHTNRNFLEMKDIRRI